MEQIQPTFIDKLLEQSPVIIVLILVCYIMYRFILSKEKVIREKDSLIVELLDKQNKAYVAVSVSNEQLINAVENLTKEIQRR